MSTSCAAVITAALVATLAAPAGAVPTSTADPVAPEVACTSSAADAAEASLVASSCDTDVEVVDERTEWNTLYAQADGTWRLDVSAVAVRTQVGGEWADIDTAVVPGEGGLTVAAPVRPMVFSDGTPGVPLAQIERDGHTLSFDVPFDLPAPGVEGDQITYDEVLPGVDLVVTVNGDATGFSEVLRVESPEAAADPRLAELTFPVETSDGLALEEDDGGFVAVDGDGERVFTSPMPAMWDSREHPEVPVAAQRSSGAMLADAPQGAADAAGDTDVDLEQAPSLASQVSHLPADLGADGVSITPDSGMIEGDDTVWPLYIDPAISGSLNEWTAVRDVFGQSYRFNPDEGVGLCNRATSTSCSATFRSRILWKFGGLASIGALEGSHITGATFAVVGTHSYDCTARPVTAYRVDNWSSATPWPGGPTWIPQSTMNVAHKSSCAGQPVRWLEFSALEAGQAVAIANSSQLTMGLAVDEGSMAYWKRFRNDAGLSISFNRPPNRPTEVKFADPAAACVTGASRPVLRVVNPVLSAIFTDPDGDPVQANVDVYTAGTSNPILWHARPAAQASGTRQSVRLGGMQNGKIYRVQINGVDPRVTGGAAVACEMEIDTVRPVAPKVTPSLYTTGVPAGGVGKAGTFTFANGGSTDVVSYKYSFNSSALNLSTAAGSPAVSFSPTYAGSQTLYFQSVDRAGWTSPTQTYIFNVAFPAATVWKLDETSGSTAVSVSPTGNVFPLTIAGTPTRVDGPYAESGFIPDDRALVLGAGTTATSNRIPVQTAENYAVSALVRADAVTGTATVLSQDGTTRAGFDLGYRPCDSGTGSCWAFSMPRADTAKADLDVALSTVPVEVGQWTLIIGIQQTAASEQMELAVCTIGDELSDGVPESARATHTSRWSASGLFRLGSTVTPGVSGWTGAVSEVRSWTGAIIPSDLRRLCNEPAA
ncbi:hypothetical protein EBM89_00225 [Cellulomonas triticagri]|uniref:LamG domain-containing protein n=1 Tax=Cellulomonas triticagri TaxID=2483352 RepID=A0A3M2JK19_9CELL|nr:hypothetical protein EBM89_00225 [Cellulomonas triticagri]